jgi:ApaG protein
VQASGNGYLFAHMDSAHDRRLFAEPPELQVTVDRVLYQPHVKTPPDRPHCFVYFITIHNNMDVPVTIRGRKWIVTNAEGKTTVLEGEGVVGETPTIEPGEKFSYNSFHLIDSPPARTEGSYIGVDGRGNAVVTRIPRFIMTLPEDRQDQ